jgi:hypothetical protein
MRTGSIATALLGFAGTADSPDDRPAESGARSVELIALILLPVALFICGYALYTFIWRSQLIAQKQARPAHGSGLVAWNVHLLLPSSVTGCAPDLARALSETGSQQGTFVVCKQGL